MKKLTTYTNSGISSLIAKLFGKPTISCKNELSADGTMTKTCTEEVKVIIEPAATVTETKAVEKRFSKINTTLSKLDYWE
ncbi:MAG: hypothetical protein JWQ38_948 [Flavipsychrobacter sp.]|nr:hypothetical protein [Flavipsychrobacter sp.]